MHVMVRQVSRMDRKEAIQHIIRHMVAHDIGKYPHIKIGEALNMAIEALQEPERKKGRWENGEPCPICGEDRFKDLYADIWADWEPPFCPNCGADMRGKK